MKITKVAVVGLGYVGLPTAVAVAKSKRYQVVGYDVSQQKIEAISNGISPIEDTDVRAFLSTNKLTVAANPNILKGANVFIICVPTPVFDDYTPDYAFVSEAVKTVAKYLTPGCHIVLESTVNPGTCKEIIYPILSSATTLRLGEDYNLAHCPERINPGDTKWTIYNINRNIGSIDKKLNTAIANFYRSFISGATINEVSSLEIAEATKIVENTFRDINIAYANELAKSFDAMGINLHETIAAASNKPFGFMPHWPGCGVGGHCIAVDPYYLIARAAKSGFNHSFLKLAREINNSMPDYCVERLLYGLNDLGKSIKNTRIALLGLSYKPNITDTRESPALKIKEKLELLGGNLVAYDPFVPSDAKSLPLAIKNVTAVVIATGHAAFISDLPKAVQGTNVELIVDGRNCLNAEQIRNLGIQYIGIGR